MHVNSNLRLWIILFITPILVSGQQAEGSFDSLISSLCSGSVPFINSQELDQLQGENDEIYILDAREKKEYEVSHIQNANWVGYEDFSKRRVRDLDKKKPVVVYCSVGYRSEKIAEKLRKEGFENVLNLYGGIFDWKNSGHKVINSEGKETEKVHTYDSNWAVWLDSGEKVYDR